MKVLSSLPAAGDPSSAKKRGDCGDVGAAAAARNLSSPARTDEGESRRSSSSRELSFSNVVSRESSSDSSLPQSVGGPPAEEEVEPKLDAENTVDVLRNFSVETAKVSSCLLIPNYNESFSTKSAASSESGAPATGECSKGSDGHERAAADVVEGAATNSTFTDKREKEAGKGALIDKEDEEDGKAKVAAAALLAGSKQDRAAPPSRAWNSGTSSTSSSESGSRKSSSTSGKIAGAGEQNGAVGAATVELGEANAGLQHNKSDNYSTFYAGGVDGFPTLREAAVALSANPISCSNAAASRISARTVSTNNGKTSAWQQNTITAVLSGTSTAGLPPQINSETSMRRNIVQALRTSLQGKAAAAEISGATKPGEEGAGLFSSAVPPPKVEGAKETVIAAPGLRDSSSTSSTSTVAVAASGEALSTNTVKSSRSASFADEGTSLISSSLHTRELSATFFPTAHPQQCALSTAGMGRPEDTVKVLLPSGGNGSLAAGAGVTGTKTTQETTSTGRTATGNLNALNGGNGEMVGLGGAAAAAAGGGSGGGTRGEAPRLGDGGNWRCDACGNINYPRRTACNRCRQTRSKENDLYVAEYQRLKGELQQLGLDPVTASQAAAAQQQAAAAAASSANNSHQPQLPLLPHSNPRGNRHHQSHQVLSAEGGGAHSATVQQQQQHHDQQQQQTGLTSLLKERHNNRQQQQEEQQQDQLQGWNRPHCGRISTAGREVDSNISGTSGPGGDHLRINRIQSFATNTSNASTAEEGRNIKLPRDSNVLCDAAAATASAAGNKAYLRGSSIAAAVTTEDRVSLSRPTAALRAAAAAVLSGEISAATPSVGPTALTAITTFPKAVGGEAAATISGYPATDTRLLADISAAGELSGRSEMLGGATGGISLADTEALPSRDLSTHNGVTSAKDYVAALTDGQVLQASSQQQVEQQQQQCHHWQQLQHLHLQARTLLSLGLVQDAGAVSQSLNSAPTSTPYTNDQQQLLQPLQKQEELFCLQPNGTAQDHETAVAAFAAPPLLQEPALLLNTSNLYFPIYGSPLGHHIPTTHSLTTPETQLEQNQSEQHPEKLDYRRLQRFENAKEEEDEQQRHQPTTIFSRFTPSKSPSACLNGTCPSLQTPCNGDAPAAAAGASPLGSLCVPIAGGAPEEEKTCSTNEDQRPKVELLQVPSTTAVAGTGPRMMTAVCSKTHMSSQEINRTKEQPVALTANAFAEVAADTAGAVPPAAGTLPLLAGGGPPSAAATGASKGVVLSPLLPGLHESSAVSAAAVGTEGIAAASLLPAFLQAGGGATTAPAVGGGVIDEGNSLPVDGIQTTSLISLIGGKGEEVSIGDGTAAADRPKGNATSLCNPADIYSDLLAFSYGLTSPVARTFFSDNSATAPGSAATAVEGEAGPRGSGQAVAAAAAGGIENVWNNSTCNSSSAWGLVSGPSGSNQRTYDFFPFMSLKPADSDRDKTTEEGSAEQLLPTLQGATAPLHQPLSLFPPPEHQQEQQQPQQHAPVTQQQQQQLSSIQKLPGLHQLQQLSAFQRQHGAQQQTFPQGDQGQQQQQEIELSLANNAGEASRQQDQQQGKHCQAQALVPPLQSAQHQLSFPLEDERQQHPHERQQLINLQQSYSPGCFFVPPRQQGPPHPPPPHPASLQVMLLKAKEITEQLLRFFHEGEDWQATQKTVDVLHTSLAMLGAAQPSPVVHVDQRTTTGRATAATVAVEVDMGDAGNIVNAAVAAAGGRRSAGCHDAASQAGEEELALRFDEIPEETVESGCLCCGALGRNSKAFSAEGDGRASAESGCSMLANLQRPSHKTNGGSASPCPLPLINAATVPPPSLRDAETLTFPASVAGSATPAGVTATVAAAPPPLAGTPAQGTVTSSAPKGAILSGGKGTTASSAAGGSQGPSSEKESRGLLGLRGIGGPHFAAPAMLAHPDEFKNPSSFLKIYGDPLCSGNSEGFGNNIGVGGSTSNSTTPVRNHLGNWVCHACHNVNFPRRFRCNKCNELRNEEGDRIVADYAKLVHYHHLQAYRQFATVAAGSTALFAGKKGFSACSTGSLSLFNGPISVSGGPAAATIHKKADALVAGLSGQNDKRTFSPAAAGGSAASGSAGANSSSSSTGGAGGGRGAAAYIEGNSGGPVPNANCGKNIRTHTQGISGAAGGAVIAGKSGKTCSLDVKAHLVTGGGSAGPRCDTMAAGVSEGNSKGAKQNNSCSGGNNSNGFGKNASGSSAAVGGAFAAHKTGGRHGGGAATCVSPGGGVARGGGGRGESSSSSSHNTEAAAGCLQGGSSAIAGNGGCVLFDGAGVSNIAGAPGRRMRPIRASALSKQQQQPQRNGTSSMQHHIDVRRAGGGGGGSSTSSINNSSCAGPWLVSAGKNGMTYSPKNLTALEKRRKAGNGEYTGSHSVATAAAPSLSCAPVRGTTPLAPTGRSDNETGTHTTPTRKGALAGESDAAGGRSDCTASTSAENTKESQSSNGSLSISAATAGDRPTTSGRPETCNMNGRSCT